MINMDLIIIIALILVSFAMLGILYRVIKGPTLADRVVGLDALGISLMAMIALFSVLLNTKSVSSCCSQFSLS